jgi:hypothetical protein
VCSPNEPYRSIFNLRAHIKRENENPKNTAGVHAQVPAPEAPAGGAAGEEGAGGEEGGAGAEDAAADEAAGGVEGGDADAGAAAEPIAVL